MSFIVAGGSNEYSDIISSVEILSVGSNTWEKVQLIGFKSRCR